MPNEKDDQQAERPEGPAPEPEPSRRPAGMASTWGLLTILFLTGVVLQHALGGHIDGVGGERIPFVLAGLAAFVLTVAAGFRPAWHRYLSSNRFSVPVILFLTVMAVLGTLILQSQPAPVMEDAYGSFAKLLQALFIDDLFHSLGFAVVLGCGAGGLALTVARRRKLTLRYSGSLAAHLGLLLVLAGAAVGNVWVVKGRLNMHVGQSADHFDVQDPKGGMLAYPLGFSVRLDDFQLDMYEPDYRLMVYSLQGDSEERLLSVDPADKADWAKLAEYGATIVDYQPDRARQPEGEPADAKAAGGPDAQATPHRLVVGGREIPVELDQPVELPGTDKTLRITRAFPDFVIDTDTKQPSNRSDQPNNPAVEVAVFGPDGKELARKFLFAKFPGFAHQGEDDPMAGVTYRYEGGDQGGSKAPSPVVTVRRATGGQPRQVRLDHPLRLSTTTALVLAPKGGETVRDYLSTLSVVAGGKKVKTEKVEVNYPLEYAGFHFYQADYRPEDPTFSGFQVVRDSGLWMVYLGFIVNMLGVLLAVGLPPLLKRRKRAASAEGAAS